MTWCFFKFHICNLRFVLGGKKATFCRGMSRVEVGLSFEVQFERNR